MKASLRTVTMFVGFSVAGVLAQDPRLQPRPMPPDIMIKAYHDVARLDPKHFTVENENDAARTLRASIGGY